MANPFNNRIIGYSTKPADQFQGNPLNYRTHPQRQRDAVQASLRELGWIGVVVENRRTGHLIDGHERVWQALKNNEPVPYIEVDLSEEEEKLALAVFDPITYMAETDSQVLDALLREVNTGESALQALLAELAQEAGLYQDEKPLADAGAQIDKAAELQVKWGTATGQLWQLGDHRLICGDCTDAAVAARVMGGEKAALTVTSPPYGVGKDYEDGGLEEWKQTIGGMLVSAASICPLLTINLGDVKVGPSHREVHTYGLLVDMCEAVNRPLIGTRIWSKGAAWAGQGPYWLSGYRAVDEFEYIGLFGDTTYVDRTQENWRYRGVWDIPSVAANKLHSASFPIELPERLIKLLCDPESIVYEPFSGSGTTIIACEQLGRKCRAVEISPAYVAVALQRWADATGKTPVLVG